jgi:hypothetical protein
MMCFSGLLLLRVGCSPRFTLPSTREVLFARSRGSKRRSLDLLFGLRNKHGTGSLCFLSFLSLFSKFGLCCCYSRSLACLYTMHSDRHIGICFSLYVHPALHLVYLILYSKFPYFSQDAKAFYVLNGSQRKSRGAKVWGLACRLMTLIRTRREQRFVRSFLPLLQEPKQHTLVGQVIHTCLYRSFPQRKSVAMDRQEYPTMVVCLTVLRRRNNARNTSANNKKPRAFAQGLTIASVGRSRAWPGYQCSQ